MIKVNTYTKTGTKKSTKATLPSEYEGDVNEDLLAQAIRVYEWRMHTGKSTAKTRSEIVASTRKIYRQKGTGRARHGAISAPIFVGGGVTHGPTGTKRSLSMSKVMRLKAKNSALAKKLGKDEVVVAEVSKIKKTKDAAKLLEKIVKNLKKSKAKFTIALAKENKEVSKAFRNIKNTKVTFFESLNAYSINFSGILVIDSDALKKKSTKSTKKGKK